MSAEESRGTRMEVAAAFQRNRADAAEARIADLEAALERLVGESESSWEHVRMVEAGDGYCRGCGFEWPCSTIAARALLSPTPEEGDTERA